MCTISSAQRTGVSLRHSHQLLGHLHPNTSVPALYAHFLELWQSAQSVPSSRFLAQILFTGRFFRSFFFAHFFCSALCHPRACAAVSASHSDQLLRTLHSTLPFLHYMLIFCSLCCLPSQSQRSDSLLKLLLHKEGVLCISCTVACPDAIKWVTSSSRNVVCTAKARSASAQPSAPVLLAFFTVLCFVPCFAGFASGMWMIRPVGCP